MMKKNCSSRDTLVVKSNLINLNLKPFSKEERVDCLLYHQLSLTLNMLETQVHLTISLRTEAKPKMLFNLTWICGDTRIRQTTKRVSHGNFQKWRNIVQRPSLLKSKNTWKIKTPLENSSLQLVNQMQMKFYICSQPIRQWLIIKQLLGSAG